MRIGTSSNRVIESRSNRRARDVGAVSPSPAYPITRLLDTATAASGELPSCLELASLTVGQRPGVDVDLDFSAAEMSANQLFGERVLDVALDGPAQRTRSVRPVLARDFDDPVDHFGRQRDLQL